MATSQDYKVATAAAQAELNADVNKLVPEFFRSDVPADMVAQIAARLGKAIVDAVDAERAKAAPQTGASA